MKFSCDTSLEELDPYMGKIDPNATIEIRASGDDPNAKLTWRLRVAGCVFEGRAIKNRDKNGKDCISLVTKPHTFISWK